MNRWLAVLLTLALPLAGCVSAPEDTEAAATDDTMTDMTVDHVLPEPIEASETVAGSADPLNFAGMPVCATPSAQCFRYPFTLTNSTGLAAELSWEIPASDFDLYVFLDGAPVEMDGQTPPGTSEMLDVVLPAGDYELVVVAWAVARDTFTLNAQFSAAA